MALINQIPNTAVDELGGRVNQGWAQFFSTVSTLLMALTMSGTTPQRPTRLLWVGRPYFDTQIGIPIWYNGTIWIDAAGSPV